MIGVNWKVATSHPGGLLELTCATQCFPSKTRQIWPLSLTGPCRQAGFILFELFQDKNAHKRRTRKYFLLKTDWHLASVIDWHIKYFSCVQTPLCSWALPVFPWTGAVLLLLAFLCGSSGSSLLWHVWELVGRTPGFNQITDRTGVIELENF